MHTRNAFFRNICLPAALLLLGTTAHAQTTVYNNTTTLTGIVQFNGAANFGGNMLTAMVADDLTLASGSGGKTITSFVYEAYYNAASGTVTARPSFFFWAADGAGGRPGTYLAGTALAPLTFTAQQVTPLTVGITGLIVPTNGRLWAGIVYDDLFGTTGATAGQMNALGGPLYGPPTLGSSADGAVFSVSGTYAGVNNPTVTNFNFGGNPPTNFGWRLQVADVPEPGSVALLVGLSVTSAGFVLRRRRK